MLRAKANIKLGGRPAFEGPPQVFVLQSPDRRQQQQHQPQLIFSTTSPRPDDAIFAVQG